MIGPSKFRHRNMIGRFAGVEKSVLPWVLGMSDACEAEWIAEGYLPWRATDADDLISVVRVVELMLFYRLSNEGWPPEDSRSVVGAAIAAVFYHAFLFVDQSLEVTGFPDDVARFRERFESSIDLASDLTGGPHRDTTLCRVHGTSAFELVEPATNNEDEISLRGVVSLRNVAKDVGAKLGRPLLSVELVNRRFETNATDTWLSSARPG